MEFVEKIAVDKNQDRSIINLQKAFHNQPLINHNQSHLASTEIWTVWMILNQILEV